MCLLGMGIVKTNNVLNVFFTLLFRNSKNFIFLSFGIVNLKKFSTSLLTLKYCIGFGPVEPVDPVEPVEPVDGGAGGADGGGADPVDGRGGGGGGADDPDYPDDPALLKKLL